ncbi:nuclear transport factor 2 family protein [Lentzea sp. NPDC059081]|uniref:nuclear transport factor 2 family protein n=1 Tax=Lentzea sp. NPDC059081 TaxID=3346719 RepID=UPI0036840754
MTAEEVKRDVAATFVKALGSKDWALLRGILTDDVTWTLPGDNRISGTVAGPDGVAERVELISSYGVDFALLHVLVSRDNVALNLHNTATRGDLVLDEHLATVFTLRGGQVARIETFLSDVDGMDRFFAA